MVILALLEIPEPTAADAIIEAAGNGVPVRRRLRYAAQRIIAANGGAVIVRFAVLARQSDRNGKTYGPAAPMMPGTAEKGPTADSPHRN